MHSLIISSWTSTYPIAAVLIRSLQANCFIGTMQLWHKGIGRFPGFFWRGSLQGTYPHAGLSYSNWSGQFFLLTQNYFLMILYLLHVLMMNSRWGTWHNSPFPMCALEYNYRDFMCGMPSASVHVFACYHWSLQQNNYAARFWLG